MSKLIIACQVNIRESEDYCSNGLHHFNHKTVIQFPAAAKAQDPFENIPLPVILLFLGYVLLKKQQTYCLGEQTNFSVDANPGKQARKLYFYFESEDMCFSP